QVDRVGCAYLKYVLNFTPVSGLRRLLSTSRLLASACPPEAKRRLRFTVAAQCRPDRKPMPTRRTPRECLRDRQQNQPVRIFRAPTARACDGSEVSRRVSRSPLRQSLSCRTKPRAPLSAARDP